MKEVRKNDGLGATALSILNELRVWPKHYTDFERYIRDNRSFHFVVKDLIARDLIETSADGGMLDLTRKGILFAAIACEGS